MTTITKLYVRLREHAAQSMTEYALIMAAIAVVCYVAYQTLGGQVTTLVTNIGNDL
jgi:Flp pilus assembly pilin Flp